MPDAKRIVGSGERPDNQIRTDRPDLMMLSIIGYAETATSGVGALAPGMQMMTKLLAVDALALLIREMIRR